MHCKTSAALHHSHHWNLLPAWVFTLCLHTAPRAFLLSSFTSLSGRRRKDWYHKRKSFGEEVKLTWNWHSKKRTWGKKKSHFEKDCAVPKYRVEQQFFVCSSRDIMREKFFTCCSSFLSTCIIWACLWPTSVHLNAYPKRVVLVWCGLSIPCMTLLIAQEY